MSELDEGALERSLEQAFRPGSLRFCHDPSYRLRESERPLCSLGEAELQRCSALKHACAAASKPEATAAKRPVQSERQSREAEVPAWLGVIAEVAFWAMIGALVVAVVMALVRMGRSRQDVEDEADGPSSIAPGPADPAPPLPSGDRDVARLLEKARRAAERGDLGAAIDAAHAAAVQGLSSTGHVEVDRDRTNGDYLRDLRKVPPLQHEFKAIVSQVEAAQFGGKVPTRGAFERLLEQVLALLRRLALLCLVMLALPSLTACGPRAAGEAEDVAPSGLYTFKKVLSDQGAKVHTRVAPLTELEPTIGLVVLLSTQLEAPEKKRLLDWVQTGGTMLVVATSDFMDAGELELGVGGCGTRAERGPGSELSPLKLAVLGQRKLQPLPAPDSVVVQRVDVTCGGAPYVMTAFLGDGMITFFPERELLSNASLSVGDNARLVAELASVEDGATVELVGPWTGEGSDSPIQSLKAAGMLPAMLQLLGLALLLAVRQGTSFGARRDETRRERRAFADHVRAIASNYARANAGRLASGHYGLLLIDQLRERLCPGQAPSLLQLAGVVARRTARPETEIVELLVEAKTSFDDPSDGQGVNHKLIRELERLSSQAGGIS